MKNYFWTLVVIDTEESDSVKTFSAATEELAWGKYEKQLVEDHEYDYGYKPNDVKIFVDEYISEHRLQWSFTKHVIGE